MDDGGEVGAQAAVAGEAAQHRPLRIRQLQVREGHDLLDLIPARVVAAAEPTRDLSHQGQGLIDPTRNLAIWRWDEMAVSGCQVATRYRKHLLHLPCHQALAEDEIAWMHTAVSAVMRVVPVPA